MRHHHLVAHLCLLSSLAASPCAHAADAAHSPIAVIGNRHIDSEVIRSHFHAGKDGTFDSGELDAALKSLYATHLFSDVKIRRLDAGIQVQVRENPLIAHIALEGNKAVKDKDLKPLLTSKESGPLSSAVVHDDVELLDTFYRRHGRFNARIDPKTIDNKNGTVNLVFEISEGPRTGVAHILFSGNHAFGSQKLNSIVKSGKSNFLSFLLDNDFYDPDKVEADRSLLLKFYRAHGYSDVQIGPAPPQYDKAKNELTLTFSIKEGPLYHFGNVAVISHVPGVTSAELDPALTTHSGDVYNSDAVDNTVEAMLVRLARHGQPFAVVKPEPERVSGQPLVNLGYRIEEGPRIYVERIEIHGNKKTRDNVIRRELTFGEGSPYNQALVQLSERHLKKLGFFK
ncbi:MAG TPA: outer membrane protein assembly factor BamA, partial [Pseudolabrys sp.]|nr:outer membrane protein assembly factor BamA [Pseudolabrys sp.]